MTSKMEIVIAAVALAICCCHTARGLDMNMLENNCQEVSHLANTNAEQASEEVYDFLRDHAADPGYNAMKVAMIGDDTYYGQAACDGKISQDECSRCVWAAYDFTINRCPFSNGAQVKFGSCQFRVENYPFDPKWKAAIVLVAPAVTLSWCYTARGMDSEPSKYVCDSRSHDPKGDAGKVYNGVLDYLRHHAGDPGYNVQKQATIGDDTYYGQAACDGNISQDECSACIGVAYTAVVVLCGFDYGALVKSASCRIRIANHPLNPNY